MGLRGLEKLPSSVVFNVSGNAIGSVGAGSGYYNMCVLMVLLERFHSMLQIVNGSFGRGGLS